MKQRHLIRITAFLTVFFGGLGLAVRAAAAAEYHVSTAGNDAAPGTAAAHFRTIHKAALTVKPGDTVFIHGGTYTESVSLSVSGTASAWITFSAFPGDLPILDGTNAAVGTGFGSSTAQYIRVVGLVARNWGSTGFGNGWVNDVGTSNGNWQFINCIADGNAINGITFYNATGLLIDQSIIAHNGNGSTSWSSGVNLFHVAGDYQTNVIRRTVSFENIDISSHHSDGSGFILDQSSSGALFENNIGFHNGGSCIRINCPGAHLINNTCWHDGMDPRDAMGAPSKPGEIYFTSGLQGAVVANNLCAASGYGNDHTAINQAVPASNFFVDSNAPTPFFANPAGIDFHLVAGAASGIIDKGTTDGAPSTDIGFDPRCIKMQAGAVSWWQYAPDYTYIASVGGVAGCFHPARRPSGAAPDLGAYEFGGIVIAGTGGAAPAAGSGGAGGGPSPSPSPTPMTGTGGRSGTGGSTASSGGTRPAPGDGGGGPGSGGSGGKIGMLDAMTGGTPAATGDHGFSATGGMSPTFDSGGGVSGAAGGGGAKPAGEAGGAPGGCACQIDPPGGSGLGWLLLAGGLAVSTRRGPRRGRPRQGVRWGG